MQDSPPLEKGGRGDLKIFVYKQTSQNPPPETGTPFIKGGLLEDPDLCNNDLFQRAILTEGISTFGSTSAL